MNNKIKSFIIVLLLLILVTSVQTLHTTNELENPNVIGNVTAETENGTIPIENAIVQGLDENNNVVSEAKTNFKGNYMFTNESISKIKIVDKGHKTNYQKNVLIDVNEKNKNSSNYDKIKKVQREASSVKNLDQPYNKDINYNYPEGTYITDQLKKLYLYSDVEKDNNKKYKIAIVNSVVFHNPEEIELEYGTIFTDTVKKSPAVYYVEKKSSSSLSLIVDNNSDSIYYKCGLIIGNYENDKINISKKSRSICS